MQVLFQENPLDLQLNGFCGLLMGLKCTKLFSTNSSNPKENLPSEFWAGKLRQNLQEEVQNERVLTSLVANHVGVKLMILILRVPSKTKSSLKKNKSKFKKRKLNKQTIKFTG